MSFKLNNVQVLDDLNLRFSRLQNRKFLNFQFLLQILDGSMSVGHVLEMTTKALQMMALVFI